MSENLVKRLREIANDPRITYCHAEHWIEEAADEIERLFREQYSLAQDIEMANARARRLEKLNAALRAIPRYVREPFYPGRLECVGCPVWKIGDEPADHLDDCPVRRAEELEKLLLDYYAGNF